MVDFKEFVIAFMLVGLFWYAFIMFGIQLSTDNNTNMSILDNNAINNSFNSISSNLDGLKADTETNKQTFFSGEPEESALGLNVKQSFAVARIVSVGFLSSIFTTIYEFLTITLGISGVVFGVFTAIFIFTFIFLIIKLLRTGI